MTPNIVQYFNSLTEKRNVSGIQMDVQKSIFDILHLYYLLIYLLKYVQFV
jgi:hypothetical protein